MNDREWTRRMNWTPRLLQAFENEVQELFEAGKIKAPVHFAGGNEKELIEIFRGIKSYDWVLCSWRSHYHALLRGVPANTVKEAILHGHSIALCFPHYRMLSSALVGGICPIATGLAWAIKKRGGREVVHCFVGDMSAMTGIYRECWRYCAGHNLPVHWVVEDNGMSVSTDTLEAWGKHDGRDIFADTRYKYEMSRPHVGVGRWVSF